MSKYKKQHVIYGLLDPRDNELRYIGYTSNPKQRLVNHHCPCNLHKPNRKNNWIKCLLSLGLRAKMIIIKEFMTAEELPIAEIKYLADYKLVGYNLTNGTAGGDGGKTPNSGAKKGERRSPATEFKPGGHPGKEFKKGQISNRRILSKEQVIEIRNLFAQQNNMLSIAKKLDIKYSIVKDVCRYKTYKEI